MVVGADYTTSQRVCQVLFRALVQLTQFKGLARPLSHPGIIAQSQRVCQVLNEANLGKFRKIRSDRGKKDLTRSRSPPRNYLEFFFDYPENKS